MKLVITIKNFPNDGSAFNFMDRIKAAILRVWKIDVGRDAKDVSMELKE